MEVILKKDLPGLGYEGDICKVKNGYARNFLIPRAIAVPVTKSSLRVLEDMKKNLEKKRAKRLEDANALKEKLDQVEITLAVKVDDRGRLYGSVTQQMILEAVNAQGYHLNKRDIELAHSIKSLGKHAITVKTFSDVFAEISVNVVNEAPIETKEETKAETSEEAETTEEPAR